MNQTVLLDYKGSLQRPRRRTFSSEGISIGLAILLLIGIGTLFQWSAGHGSWHFLSAHLQKLSLAILAGWLCSLLPAQWYNRLAWMFYGIGILSLIGVFFFGKTIKGAQRWLSIGPFNVEPSEFMKVALPLYLAHILSMMHLPIRFTSLLMAISVLLIPFGLIVSQPDLGTGLLLLMIGASQIFASGLHVLSILGIVATLMLCAPLIWHSLHSYQQLRILTLLFPKSDSSGAGYHILQSKIAIGSGGLNGKGLLASSQVKYHFLPEFHTDFIFALIAEESGLFGCSLIFLLYLILILGLLRLAYQQSDAFTRLYLVGTSAIFFICACVNTAMVAGLIPVVGIPLPFLSYGGSNLIVCGVALGIALALMKGKP